MIEIQPVSKFSATVDVPPSKSYTNRALLIAALADGESRIDHPLFSDDTTYMSQALNRFGIPVRKEAEAFAVSGKGGRLEAPDGEIRVGNAGTAMRFLTTFACLAPGVTRLTGDARMQQRPVEDLLRCLREMNVRAVSEKNNGCPPLEIHGGPVPGGEVHLAGDKSSQYLTSLLLSAPYFQNDTTIHILGELTSKSYADITLDIMRSFGVHAKNERYGKFHVAAGQRYRARTYRVEGDWSSASYFLAAAAVTGGEVTLTGLNPESVQGDAGFLGVLEQMGCSVTRSGEKIRLKGNLLKGITINMNTMPDAVQTLAVTALFARGETVIHGIGNLRIKETDRIHALATELSRLGARVDPGDDFLKIQPGDYSGQEVETYNDHRMAMSFAVAGLKIPGIKIKNPQCVEKSFPDFFERLRGLYQ
ncbi:MAG: 3-phosphoshikimate 1-carboxyvinyltransferase [Nitrospinaceae bacterium]